MEKQDLLKRASEQRSEDSYIDFKEEFDPRSRRDIVEIIKDIVAMANSGGGCILIGVKNDGTVVQAKLPSLVGLDPAQLSDKIDKFTGIQSVVFEYEKVNRQNKKVDCILVERSFHPIVFENPGTYPIEQNRQKTAFGRGTIYFRHSSKSEPANNQDIRELIEREIGRIRESWLGNIRKVVEAPTDHIVYMLPPDVVLTDKPDATAIRITDSEEAPAYRIDNPDKHCPFRQKDVIDIVNTKLKGKYRINQYDILSIRNVYKIDETKPQFFYQSKFGPKQYSEKFASWIEEMYKKNNMFFLKTREEYSRVRRVK